MMNKILAFVCLGFTASLMGQSAPVAHVNSQDGVKWMTWQQAADLSKAHPKKVFVDVYTDWCGWCKRMDASTFQDPDVIKYLNDHFYSVKLNAEMKEDVQFKDHTFKWVNTGRNGIHTLAYSLLEGHMSYPTFVTMNENYDRIAIMPGYKPADQLLKELRFAAEEVYKDKSWDDYNSDN